MARRPPTDGASWSARELKTLKALPKAGTPTGQVAKKLGRTAAAVQQKAMRARISFRAAKRSGARRKKYRGTGFDSSGPGARRGGGAPRAVHSQPIPRCRPPRAGLDSLPIVAPAAIGASNEGGSMFKLIRLTWV